MLKILSKSILLAAVASLVLAGSMTTSDAAKKKKKAAAPAPACTWPMHKAASCNNGVCSMTYCGPDGKWYPSLLWCWQPFCAK